MGDKITADGMQASLKRKGQEDRTDKRVDKEGEREEGGRTEILLALEEERTFFFDPTEHISALPLIDPGVFVLGDHPFLFFFIRT
jgi:hypothetical protein